MKNPTSSKAVSNKEILYEKKEPISTILPVKS